MRFVPATERAVTNAMLDGLMRTSHTPTMRFVASIASHDSSEFVSRTLRDLGLGFLYWLSFVLVLEPGNLLRLAPPDAAAWGWEILRLAAAGVLGGAATPFILAFARRLPIEGPRIWRRATIHLGFCGAMALALVVASCLLAAMILPGPAYHPLKARIADELLGNGLLVAACVAGMVALAHAARAINPPRTADHARVMLSKARGRMARLDLDAVEWIETQGNYLALHGREGTKLLRRTAKSLEAELDPRRFVRVHRRTIIAVDAVRAVSPLSAGDATIRLAGGEELRVSRSHRAQLWKALEEAGV